MVNTKKSDRSIFLFLMSLALFMFSPFTLITTMSNMISDTAIQIKIGLDSIASGHIILDEIYSWHPDLIFTAHEAGWYVLLGAAYKFLGIAGVITVGAVFTYVTAYFCIKHSIKVSNPFIAALVMVVVPFMSGFPDYSVRPSCTSLCALAIFIYVYMEESFAPRIKYITFIVCCFALGWLHGGILPAFAAVMVLLAVIDLIFKRFKGALWSAVSIVAGFLVSLLNPIGIRVWTFGLKQSAASDVWCFVDEWNPKTFSILEAVLVLLLFIGFMVDDRVRKFDKKTITRLGIMCMFFVATCVYKRFMLQFSVMYLMFAPEELTILVSWLNENLLKIKKKLELQSRVFALLAAVCVIFAIASGFLRCTEYFQYNSMQDIENMAAYDHDIIGFIKEKGYERPFNSFNTGSWLAFSGVPVHIDNRIDPYMQEYSGVDHIRGKNDITSLDELDYIESEYACDAFILEVPGGYSYLLYEIDTYASDRYTVVYDNTVTSGDGSFSRRWIIIEPS